MNVTIVCDVLGEANNGTTIAAFNLADSLKKKGHKVTIICSDEEREGQEGFLVVPTRTFPGVNWYFKKNCVKLAKPDDDILIKAFKESDIVHGMLPFHMAQRSSVLCKELGIPMTSGFHAQAENFTSHVFLMNSKLANKGFYIRFLKRYYQNLEAIHYPTQFIHDYVAPYGTKHLKYGDIPAYVISNGVNKRFYKKEVHRPKELEGKYLILTSGRYSKEKAQNILIKAVGSSKYKDKIQLILAGAGPREKQLRKLGEKLPNKPIMKFYGREEIADVINMCDLYVHPATIEIEAISCVEALACGLVPVISDSKRSATNKFALHDENLFKNNNYKDLAKKIDYWIEHPEEKAKVSDEYVIYRQKFDFDTCMDKMEKMLLEVIENYKKKKKCAK